MNPLLGYRWHRLVTVPRIEDVPDPRRWVSASVAAAVTTAHAALLDAGESAGMAVAWVRPPDGGPLRFLIGGRPGFPPLVGDGAVPGSAQSVLFPPGATAEPVPEALPGSWFGSLPSWLRCLGTTALDDPRRDEERDTSGEAPAGLDDYAMHLRSPFVWLVVAEPASRDELEDEAAETTARLTTVRKRESSESHQVDLERGQRRMRELVRARGSGLWKVHVLAGAGDDAAVRQAANLLCGAADAAGAGHMLFPADKPASLATTWAAPAQGSDRAASPFRAGADVVATLVRPPVRELPGIRLLAPFRFDVTPVPWPPGESVDLGSVVDESLRPVGRFTVPYATLNRHGFICGATGSGKSQTARRLLESLSTGPRRVPWLVIEPAKAEYAAMAGRLEGRDEVLVIRPGDLGAPPASLNPLEPEPGFPLQSHADLVRALFLAAFEANEPFPQVLSHALTECYTAAGWNLVTGRLRRPVKPKYRVNEPDEPAAPRYPSLRELQATARRVVDNIGYGKEVAADVRGFVDVRMGSLRQGTPGRFFEGGHPLDIAELLRRNVVFELESVTNDQDKAFLMGTVLIRIVEHLRVRGPAADLQHVMLIEEAHRLLKNVHEGPAAAAVELFASLLAEIRAYGEGVVIAEQIPSKILPDVVKNTAFKVMHRLPARDDRDAVGATMNLTEANSEAVVSLAPGFGAVSADGDDRPLLVAVDGGWQRESSAGALLGPPLRGRRSALCGSECAARACTLDELDTASAVADEPGVVVWTEAVAAAMVLGRTTPRPRDVVRRVLIGDARGTDCLLATLADRAVAARQRELAPWVAPEDFARRLRDVLGAGLVRRPLSVGEPGRWRAGAFRWQTTYNALYTATRAADDAPAGPHPDTDLWRTFGLDLDPVDVVTQFEQLKNDPAYAHGGERVLFGDPATSGLAPALTALGGSVTANGLRRALLHSCDSAEQSLYEDLARHFGAALAGSADG